jgi:hypothetical protein
MFLSSLKVRNTSVSSSTTLQEVQGISDLLSELSECQHHNEARSINVIRSLWDKESLSQQNV